MENGCATYSVLIMYRKIINIFILYKAHLFHILIALSVTCVLN